MNKNRKAKRSYELGKHHFYKGNYFKAVSSLNRARDISNRYFFNEDTLFLLSQSWYSQGDIKKALDIINEALTYSGSYLDALEFKLFLLKQFGESTEVSKLSKKIDVLKKGIDSADIDSYCQTQ